MNYMGKLFVTIPYAKGNPILLRATLFDPSGLGTYELDLSNAPTELDVVPFLINNCDVQVSGQLTDDLDVYLRRIKVEMIYELPPVG